MSLARDGRGHTILAWVGTNPSGLDVAHRATQDNGWVPQEVVAKGQLAVRTNQQHWRPVWDREALLARRGTLE